MQPKPDIAMLTVPACIGHRNTVRESPVFGAAAYSRTDCHHCIYSKILQQPAISGPSASVLKGISARSKITGL